VVLPKAALPSRLAGGPLEHAADQHADAGARVSRDTACGRKWARWLGYAYMLCNIHTACVCTVCYAMIGSNMHKTFHAARVTLTQHYIGVSCGQFSPEDFS
jgi:hypothetical protein